MSKECHFGEYARTTLATGLLVMAIITVTGCSADNASYANLQTHLPTCQYVDLKFMEAKAQKGVGISVKVQAVEKATGKPVTRGSNISPKSIKVELGFNAQDVVTLPLVENPSLDQNAARGFSFTRIPDAGQPIDTGSFASVELLATEPQQMGKPETTDCDVWRVKHFIDPANGLLGFFNDIKRLIPFPDPRAQQESARWGRLSMQRRSQLHGKIA